MQTHRPLFGPDGRPVTTHRPPRALASEHAFEAARRVGYRGMFWFPSLDPKIQMPTFTRTVIAEKVNWLYNNVAFLRCVIDGLSLDEVDVGIWPKAATSSEAFNTAATDRYHESWGKDPRFFDCAQKDTAYSGQFLIRRHIRLHGAAFAQLIRPGEGYATARISFLPDWQIRNANVAGDQEEWRDGVKTDRLQAPLAYRVVTNSEGTTFEDVPAADMLHCHDEFWIGQQRGVSGLAPIARKLFTLDDIEKALANGIQLRSLMAYAIEKKEGDTGGPGLIPGATEIEEVEQPDGSILTIQKVKGINDSEVSVADVPAGRSIKVLEANQTIEPFSFKKDVLTDVAYCTKYPPQYVFDLAGLGQGTLVRLTMRRVQVVKATVRWFQLIPQFLEPSYRFKTWQDIKAGMYDRIPGGVPADWYKVKWNLPEDLSVDLGKEGRLYDERLASGNMSPEHYHGITGQDAADVEDDVVNTRKRRERKLKAYNEERAREGLPPLKFEDLWPKTSSIAAAAMAAKRSTEDPEEKDE